MKMNRVTADARNIVHTIAPLAADRQSELGEVRLRLVVFVAKR